MKDNHVPVNARLMNRISIISNRISDYSIPIGKGNPYNCCRHCGISDSALHVTNEKHYKGCPVPGWGKEIVHYYNILLDNLEFTSARERNICFQDMYYLLFSGAGISAILPVYVPKEKL